ncbi:hypothetical protein ACFV7Q_13445, partial [Streptomyces sp. NPDC059851]
MPTRHDRTHDSPLTSWTAPPGRAATGARPAGAAAGSSAGACAPADPAAGSRTRAPARAFAWSRNDALVAVGAAAVDLTGYSLGVTGEGRPLTVPALALLVSAGLCLVLRRRHALGTLAAVLALGVLLNLTTPLIPHFGAALAVALYSVARFNGGRVAGGGGAPRRPPAPRGPPPPPPPPPPHHPEGAAGQHTP